MAIIDKLFNRNPELKKEAATQKLLNKLSSLKPTELETIIASEEDLSLRCEAVMHLEFGTVLQTLAFDEKTPALARSGRQRIADLIDAESLPLDRFTQNANLDQQLAIAALLAKEEKQQGIFNTIDDESTLLQVAKENTSARIRSWAADKLVSDEARNELLKHSKGKDKSVYKLIKAKLDSQHSQQQQQQAVSEKINELLEAVERHSKTTYDQIYQAKKDHLKQQWQAVESHADQQQKNIIDRLFDDCEQVVVEAQPKKDQQRKDVTFEETSEETTEEKAGTTVGAETTPVEEVPYLEPELVQRQRGELIEGMKKVLHTLIENPEAIDRNHTELNCKNIASRWRELQKQPESSEEDNRLFDEMSKVIDKELEHLERNGSIGKHFQQLLNSQLETDSHSLVLQEKSIAVFKRRLQSVNELSGDLSISVQSTVQEFEQWQQKRKAQLDQQQTLLRQITGLLKKSRIALQIGKTAQAQGIRATLEEKSEKVQSLPKHIHKQIQELDEQLGKVKDWKDYATLPKKEELLEQMQGLVGSNENPEALATKIKRLQDEWKVLSKGGFTDDGGLWESFREAGDRAYQPCAEYFAEQAKHRAENVAKRETVVTQLEDYDARQNWDSPDWRQVAKLVQVAFNEWRTYQPVERSANKPVQDRFDTIIGSIRGKLNDEYARNKDGKKALIEQAKNLLEAEDNRKAIDEIKLLQNRWKLLGSASHKTDQALWKQFRKHCDAVFEKRKQLSTEFKAELNENKTKVVALCEELEKLAALSLSEMLEQRDRVAEIRSAYHDIGSLPKAQASELQQRFRQDLDNFDKKIVDEKAKAKAGAWDSMLSAYEQVMEYRLSMVQDGVGEELKTKVEATINAEGEWPKGSQEILKKLISTASSEQCEPNERRLLCIRAEILADLETPAEDQSLRMEYQVQQLAKGFGQGGQKFKNGREALQALLLEWIGLQPSQQENYAALMDRMNICRKKIGV